MQAHPNEAFLPQLVAQLALAQHTLSGVVQSLESMRRNPDVLPVVVQTRHRHRDECEAAVERLSRAIITRRAALVKAIVEQLPIDDPWQCLEFANRLSDLEPARLELLASVPLKPSADVPPRSAAATREATRHLWYLEFATVTEAYRDKHSVGLTRHGLANAMDRGYSSVDYRLRALARDGYNVDALLAGLSEVAGAKPDQKPGQPAR